jgi:exopolysaccharide biosynthesis polyprenyl glycosylphosphotransferase
MPASHEGVRSAGSHYRESYDSRRWLLVADAMAIAAAILLVIGFRRAIGRDIVGPFESMLSHRTLFAVYGLTFLVRLGMSGQYDLQTRFARIDDILTVLRAAFVASALSVFLAIVTKGWFVTGFTNYSRLYVAVAFTAPVVLVLAMRLWGKHLQDRAFSAGRTIGRTLIVGTGPRAQAFTHWLDEQHYLGLEAMRSSAPVDNSEHFARALGDELDRMRPTEVVLAFDEPQSQLQVACVREAAYRGVAVKVLPGVFESYQASYFEYGGVPVTTLFESPRTRFARHLKNVFDHAGAALGLVVLLPLFALVGIAIKLTSRGPVFYRQDRVGLHGRRFRFWKFRSMRADADERLEQTLAEHPEWRTNWEQFQKLPTDPRVTALGRFLRRWSIDELPQLINVLFGEMSLVGPRPPMPHQLDTYGAKFVFSQMRPGITGLWQVSGRNELSFDQRVDLEVYYVENWSFALDLRILLKTVRVVLLRRGAY